MKIALKTVIVLANSFLLLFEGVAGLSQAVAVRQSSITFSDSPTAGIGAAYCKYTSCFAILQMPDDSLSHVQRSERQLHLLSGHRIRCKTGM